MWGNFFKIDRIVRPEATQLYISKIHTGSQPAEGHTTQKKNEHI